MNTYRILFIDDDEHVLEPVTRYFAALGHDVFSASSGTEGLGLFEQVEPHVTVVDYSMPGMSGLDVLAALRRKHATVIMLTGRGEVATAVEAMRLGAETFLQKPIDMPHLAAAVEKAAEKAELRRHNRELRARLRPGLKRRLARVAVIVVLVAGAIGLGSVVGGGRDYDRPERPIPVPLEPAGSVQ